MNDRSVRRPWGVWLVFLFYVLALVLILLDLAVVHWMAESQIPLTEAQKGVANAGVLTYVPAMINVIAAIFLFRLRWTAVPLFGIGFAVISGFCWFWEYPPPVGSVVGWIVTLAALLYAIRLKQVGILN